MKLIDWIKINLPVVGEFLAWLALLTTAGTFLLPLVLK